MDGEAVVSSMNYDDWTAAEMEAELAKLQEFRVSNFMCHQKTTDNDISFLC